MSEPVYFLNLEIKNYRCFKDKQVLDLSDGKGNWRKWTVILGDNGMGKSTILQLLASSEIRERVLENGEIRYGPTRRSLKPIPPLSGEIPGFFKVGLNIFYEQSENRFSETLRVSFSNNKERIHLHNDIRLKNLKCFGYGANRKMGISSLSSSTGFNSESLFNEDERLINAEEWLLQLDYAASKDSELKNFAINKRKQVMEILIDLLPDVSEISFTKPTKENLKSSVEFLTPFGLISIHQLSLGYKTMVTWIVDLAARMFERYSDNDNPLAEPAIVLVDEIDLHLHPKWQRKIFDYLSDKFPKTQFIVTAHSPLIVQSAPRNANIVLLRKEGDRVVIDNDLKSVNNWRLDQILTSDLFGLDSARGKEAEEKLKERKELLAKEKLSKKERDRLNELNFFANSLPTAYNHEDIEAMSIVQEAAEYLKNKKK